MSKPKSMPLIHPRDKAEQPKPRKPYAAKMIETEKYDPEAEFAQKTVTAHDFYERSAVNLESFKKGKTVVRGRIAVLRAYKDGKMAESSKQGKGWRLGYSKTQESDRHVVKEGTKYYLDFQRIETPGQFKKLYESQSWQTAKLLETFGADAFGLGFDDGLPTGTVTGPPNGEFIPLLGGPSSKQLYLTDYLDMHAKAFWAKNHHPFGKAIVTIKRSFTIGKGVKLLFKNTDCQKAWDAFEKRAKFQEKLRTDVETLIWAGEIMTEKTTENEDGTMRPSVAQVDPSTVWEIVTDPLTPEIPIYFHQQFPTQWQLVYKAQDKSVEYVINDIDAKNMIHHKINTAPGEKRGRSDLFAVLSWLKRYRDFFNAKVVKAQMEESWALDISIDGSQGDVDAIAQNSNVTRVPPPGSTRVHNKDVEYAFLQPTSSSTQGRDNVGEQLKNVIAVGAGIAPEWLGESASGSSRQTAYTKESPAQRGIEDFQQVTERYIRDVADYVMATDLKNTKIPVMTSRPPKLSFIKQAIKDRDWAKAVKEATALMTGQIILEPTSTEYEVIFPESEGDDRAAKITAIIQGEANKYISHNRAATMFASEMRITDYDAEDEQQEIQEEQDLGGGNAEWQQQGKPGQQGQPPQKKDANGNPVPQTPDKGTGKPPQPSK